MQIKTATKEELGLLIKGLDSFFLQNQQQDDLRIKLLKQMRGELLQRYGMLVSAMEAK